MELPATMSFTIARASESQFIYIIRNELAKYKIWASVFDCSKGIDRRSISSMRTESLLASPVSSIPSSPEIIYSSDDSSDGTIETKQTTSNLFMFTKNTDKQKNQEEEEIKVKLNAGKKMMCNINGKDECERKANKLCRVVISRGETPVFI